MIYLFHGENQVLSRQALTALRGDYDQFAVTTLSEFSFPEFVEACEARALFSSRRLVVLEVSDQRRLPKDKRFLNYLRTLPEETGAAFWIGGNLRKNHALLKLVSDIGEAQHFPASKEKPFPFLDALADKDLVRTYRELGKLSSKGRAELYLLQMIAWKVRGLLRAKTGGGEKLSSYVYKRAESQSKNFSEEELVAIFGQLVEADVAMKTGSDPGLVMDKLLYSVCGMGDFLQHNGL